MTRASGTLLIVLGALLALYCLELAFGVLPASAATVFEKFATNVVFLGAAALCAVRGFASRRESAAWLVFGTGLALWGLGNLYFTLFLWDLDEIPIPSAADLGYLAFYLPVYAGLVMLVRARVPGLEGPLWLDGIVGALAVAAVGATVIFDAVQASTGGAAAAVATNLAYPLADLLLCSLVIAVLGASGWKIASTWGWIASALCVFAITDSLYLYGTAKGTYSPGALIDAGWPLAAWLMAVAAWRPVARTRVSETHGWRTIGAPIAFALVALGLLVYDHFVPINALALALATAAVVAVLGRLVLTFAENVRTLAASRREAMTDALTGLGNRRRLLQDLASTDMSSESRVLALYDLDGFKGYNDTFGHMAGDALLVRLAAKFGDAVGGEGTAYRLGGDEFCALWPSGAAEQHEIRVRTGAAALSETGEGFAIGCSHGFVTMPLEAGGAEAALRTADQRMYRHKQAGRRPGERQGSDPVQQALAAGDRDPSGHVPPVIDLAEAVGRRLAMDTAGLEGLRLAAQLHDIGKVAIPDAILNQPRPLNDADSAFIGHHTVIGEHILATAPALGRVAGIVRASHERVDGTGYPDGLPGDRIPLESRIMFVCHAFNAMVSDRPYRCASTTEAALAELQRCAGTQFDPSVVRALDQVLTDGTGERWAPAQAPTSPRG